MYLRLLWDLYKLKRNSLKNSAQIKKLQQKKLKKLLHYAYENSEYYQMAFKRAGISEKNIDQIPLNQFPSIDKEILLQHYNEIVTKKEICQEEMKKFDENSSNQQNYLKDYHIVHSSGSTGIAKYFIYDKKAWYEMLLGIIRGALWGMNMIEILKLLAEKPRILYIAATDGRYGGAMAVHDGIKGLKASQEFLDINTRLDQWTKKIIDFQPNIVIGYLSAIKLLAEQMEKDNIHYQLKRVISCGEPLVPGLRTFLEQHFRCSVINFYGASESLALGLEEKEKEGMILFDDLNIIEVEHNEMYITCLYNFTQPLIRYHLTDKLILKEETEQSYGFLRADVLLCRNEDVLWFERMDGTREFLHPLSIEGFCIEGLLDYQFVQTSIKTFEIRAEIAGNTKKEMIAKEIENLINPLLKEKRLEDIWYGIVFIDSILPEEKTGKKKLIIRKEESRKEIENKGRKNKEIDKKESDKKWEEKNLEQVRKKRKEQNRKKKIRRSLYESIYKRKTIR